jgi:hypothetical protein
MARRRWIQIDGQLVEVTPGSNIGSGETSQKGPTVLGDLPDFVSPIDGTVVSGRRGLREHCLKHDVVPLADCAGLPPRRLFDPNTQISEQHREGTRRTIAEIINSRNYK